MKKWLISLMVPALIGTASFSTSAATIQNDYTSVKFNNGVITIRQHQPEKAQNPLENRPENLYANGQKNDSEDSYGNNDQESNGWENGRWGYRRDRDDRDRDHRDRDRREDRQSMKDRDDARYIINRTAPVIFRAQRTARIHRHYAGFAQAIAHQNKARELFRAGRYREAIFHSLRARRLAMLVIRGNRENWSGYGRDDREERYGRMAPKDNDLDVQVDWNKVGDDDATVHIQFNLNVN